MRRVAKLNSLRLKKRMGLTFFVLAMTLCTLFLAFALFGRQLDILGGAAITASHDDFGLRSSGLMASGTPGTNFSAANVSFVNDLSFTMSFSPESSGIAQVVVPFYNDSPFPIKLAYCQANFPNLYKDMLELVVTPYTQKHDSYYFGGFWSNTNPTPQDQLRDFVIQPAANDAFLMVIATFTYPENLADLDYMPDQFNIDVKLNFEQIAKTK